MPFSDDVEWAVSSVIPRSDVALTSEVDLLSLRTPSLDDLENGGFATRSFSFQLVVDATWEEAAELLLREREAVSRVVAVAADEDDFDERAAAEEGDVIADELEGFVAAPDLGVRAAVTALCAAGCVTAASCRGHPGDHAWATHPVILLTADRRRARILVQICRDAGCGIANAADGRLEIWAPSVYEMLEFAGVLIERRQRFESLALPAALRRARGLPAPARSEQLAPRGQGTLF
jgi:hypothetical protein